MKKTVVILSTVSVALVLSASSLFAETKNLKDREYYRSLPPLERILTIVDDYAKDMTGVAPKPTEMEGEESSGHRPGGDRGNKHGDEHRPPNDGGRKRHPDKQQPRTQTPPPPPPRQQRHERRDNDSCGTGLGVWSLIGLPAAFALNRKGKGK
jgi:hypothetical protein